MNFFSVWKSPNNIRIIVKTTYGTWAIKKSTNEKCCSFTFEQIIIFFVSVGHFENGMEPAKKLIVNWIIIPRSTNKTVKITKDTSKVKAEKKRFLS